jgi:hypothetical protein
MHGLLKTLLSGENEKRLDSGRIAEIKLAFGTFSYGIREIVAEALPEDKLARIRGFVKGDFGRSRKVDRLRYPKLTQTGWSLIVGELAPYVSVK